MRSSPDPEAEVRRKGQVWVLVLIVASLVLRIAIAALTPPLRVETYYWTWSQEPAWGYTDHPPMAAVIIGFLSPLLGHSVLGIRLGPIVLSTVAALIFWRLALRLVTPRAALASLSVLLIAPFWFPFGIVATPDFALLFFWTLSLLCFHDAWSRDTYGGWIAAGVSSGLAIISKYNGFLLPGVFLAFLLLNEKGRRQLRGLRPLLGFLVTMAIVAPNLYWNSRHGGSTAATPLREGVEFQHALKNVGLYVLLPFGLLTPPIAFAWIRQTIAGLRAGRLRRDPSFQLALCATWLPFAAFGPVSLLTLIHFHWPATCMLLALPLALENLGAEGPGASRRFLRGTLVSTWALVAVAALGAAVGLAVARPDPGAGKQRGLARVAAELTGWEELGARLQEEIAKRKGDGPFFVASFTFHLSSTLDWMLRHRYPVFPLDPEHRRQYANWHSETDFAGQDAICVDVWPLRKGETTLLGDVFASVEPLPPVRTRIRGVEIRRFELFWCRGYKGTPSP